MNRFRSSLAAIATTIAFTLPAMAAPPFSEDFAGGTSNWRFNNTNDPVLDGVSAGGPDGSSYLSRTGVLPAAGSQVIFRAHKAYGSSGGAYTGDWIAAGAYQVSAFIRHNASEPLSFNLRLAGENNFPGASYFSTSAVPANAWTQLTYNILPNSPQLAEPTYEETSYQAVYSGFEGAGIGNMQFSVVIPQSLRGAGPFKFDLDKVVVSVVPEPATGLMGALAVLGIARAARRRRGK